MSTDISVVIRCKNEERWIGHAIQSVLDRADNAEIIIAYDHSTDDSLDIIRGFESWSNIKKIHITDYSPGKVLNECARIVNNEYVLVLSAHCCITKMDLNKVKKNFEEHHYGAIFGQQIPVYRGRKINRRNFWSHFKNEKVINMWSKLENRYFLHNAICFYKKSLLNKHPFDEKLYGKEDRYWVNDMIKLGHKFLYDPDICCFHHWTKNGASWKGIG